MSQRIVVIGRSCEETETLVHRLGHQMLHEVEHYHTAQEAIQSLTRAPADLLGLSLPIFNLEKMTLLQQFRNLGYDFPMLVYARAIAKEALRAVQEIPGAVVLESPSEQKRMVGIANKMMTGGVVLQQRHRRFVTEQFVQVEPFRQIVGIMDGCIRNLSETGAFIECADPSLNVGDMIRFHVSLNELARKHTISARVVWREAGNDLDPAGYGVSFMRPGDVYQNLLKNI